MDWRRANIRGIGLIIRTLLFLFFCLTLTLTACGTPEEQVESYLAKAQEQFDAEQYETAKLEVANALQIEPKNTRGRLLLAKIALAEGRFGAALDALLIAVESDPALLEARVLLGEIYYLGKMVDELEEQVDVAEQIDPADPQVLLLRSRVLAMRGDNDGALAKIDETLVADPEMVSAVIFKASLLARSGDSDAGIALLDERIAAMETRDTAGIRRFRIVLLEGAGRNADIESALKSLAQDFPENSEFSERLVRRLFREGRTADAEQALEELARRDDAGYARRVDFVEFLATQRSPEAAEEAIKDFLRAAPESIELQLTLGNLHDSQGRLDDALAVYGEVVKIAPASDEAFEARNRTVSILVRQGKPEEARALIAATLPDRPDDT